MRTIEGDLIRLGLDGHFDVIAHGCNCMHVMGAGLAAQIRAEFPAAFEADRATPRADRTKLGTCSLATVATPAGTLHVVNAYTQFDYRGKGVHADYEAIGRCMAMIRDRFKGQRLGLPLIGAGLAGGDWCRIEGIIGAELSGEDVTIVSYRRAA